MPTGYTPAQQVCSIDHLLELVIGYADRDTHARLMRVCKHFYTIVARPLYRSVALFDNNIDTFILGAHNGCHCDECLEMQNNKYGFDSKIRFQDWQQRRMGRGNQQTTRIWQAHYGSPFGCPTLEG